MKTESNFLLAAIKRSHDDYERAKRQVIRQKNLRDYYIIEAFEAGCRQKEIANASGLSVRTVKLIIGELRKENHELQTR